MTRIFRFGVIGCGLMGREFASAAARWLHLADVKARPEIVAVCDTNATLLDWFKDHAFDPASSDTIASVREVTKGGTDVVIECAGVPDTLQSGLRMARRGGTFVLFGVTPAGVEVPVLPFDLLVNEVDIRPAYLNPFTHSRAAAMVANGALELDALVTKTIGLEEVADVVGNAPLPGEIKVIVRP